MKNRPITLAGLRGFEAAARLGSLTAAAHELFLSQSALSRQIQSLEVELGFAVFTRGARDIALTTAGSALQSVVREALARVDLAVERGRQHTQSPRISITTFASFASLWLIPRLGELRAQVPEIELEVSAVDRLVDIETEGIDVAIRYLAHEQAPPEAIRLMEEILFPLASREYLARSPQLRTADDLVLHPLIEAVGTGPGEAQNSWPAFLKAQGVLASAPRPALRVDFIAQGLQAARRGQGLAMAHTYGADLYMDGDLVQALPIAHRPSAGTYCLVARHARTRPHVQLFVEWLTQAAATFNNRHRAWLRAHPTQPSRNSKKRR